MFENIYSELGSSVWVLGCHNTVKRYIFKEAVKEVIKDIFITVIGNLKLSYELLWGHVAIPDNVITSVIKIYIVITVLRLGKLWLQLFTNQLLSQFMLFASHPDTKDNETASPTAHCEISMPGRHENLSDHNQRQIFHFTVGRTINRISEQDN